MGKSGKDGGGFLAPKQIANRIKAKGLQKLRWYCQMCNKQCRDENGFKCHCMSESHQRQMAMFTENSGSFMDEFSKEFEAGMLEIIRRKARSQRCSANVIYREYISERNHFHMNSTIWETLTDFVMYLGRTDSGSQHPSEGMPDRPAPMGSRPGVEGKCEVDETEKGWFVTYIDRDPETLARMEARAKRERSELDSEEKHQRDLERQVKAARALESDENPPAPTELQRADPSEKVTVAVKAAAAKTKVADAGCSLFNVHDEASTDTGGAAGSSAGHGATAAASSTAKSRTSGIQALMAQEMKRKEASTRSKYWLYTGIIVKVMNKALRDGKYYKQKGTIEKVVDRDVAHVRMHASGDLIKVEQVDLETVIPAEGGWVLIVNGVCRGERARLLSINIDRFCVKLKIVGGQSAGRELDGVEYEDVCKLSDSTS